MKNNVIAQLEQVNVAWLTAALSRSGALEQGVVTGFDVGEGRGNWSANAALTIYYSAESIGHLPRHLFLKMVSCDTGDDEFFSDSEVTYYTHDYVDVADAPLIRVYDAAYDKGLLRYHLLMDDVSETHRVAAAKSPTLAYGLALAEGLAAMHARWWGQKAGPMHSAEHIRSFVAVGASGVEHILKAFSAELKSHWPDLMRAVYTHCDQLMIERTQNRNGFTVIHGDVGKQNILVPHEGDRPIYIIDRQPFNWGLTTWLGVNDLAYAIVLDWDMEVRRRFEMPVLRHYHQQLIKHGVVGYTWQQLLEDYKLSVAMCVSTPIEYCRGGINIKWIDLWPQMLKRALMACDDLNCSELWQ